MPLYELFCLARPRLGNAQLAEIIKLAGRTVLDKGGVITDVKSYGEQELAYEIRKPGERHTHVSSSRRAACRRRRRAARVHAQPPPAGHHHPPARSRLPRPSPPAGRHVAAHIRRQ